MKGIFSIYWILVCSIWYFVNGLLHDIFVLIRHKGPYDRELLRLLMDGHVLLLSGALAFTGYMMLQNKIFWGGWINIIVATGMLIYFAMIYPFLKSIGTMIISLILIVISIRAMQVN